MMNEHVLHLASLVRVGTLVTVQRSLRQGHAPGSPDGHRQAAQARRRSARALEYRSGWRVHGYRRLLVPLRAASLSRERGTLPRAALD